MTDAPIPLTLDLWALGHSASQIAQMLGYSSHKAVSRVIAQARSIGDKRAVLHCGANGRLLGRPGRTGRKVGKYGHKVAGKEVAELISKAKKREPKPRPVVTHCIRGHARTPDNIGANRGCLACKRLALRLKEARI